MPLVILLCGLLVVATTVLHYEVLRFINGWLPSLVFPERAKLVIVILVAFVVASPRYSRHSIALH